jgi:hypothetical protein
VNVRLCECADIHQNLDLCDKADLNRVEMEWFYYFTWFNGRPTGRFENFRTDSIYSDYFHKAERVIKFLPLLRACVKVCFHC